MHHIQICSLKNKTWTTLPYMVIEREIDEVIARWPPTWKICFKTPVKSTAGTSAAIGGPSRTTKKDVRAAATKNIPPKQPPNKDTTAGTQDDSHDTNVGGTKWTGEPVKGT